MWELDHKEGWVQKNWYSQLVMLEKTLESPLGSKEIKPVHPKGNQPWIFIGRTDVEAPIPWPLDVKSQLTEKKTLMLGKTEIRRGRDDRRWDSQVALLTQCTNLSNLRETVKDRGAWCAAIHGVTESWTRLSDWTNKQQQRWLGVGYWEIRGKKVLFSWGKAYEYDCFFSPKILLSVSAWKVQRNAQNGLPLRDTEETGREGSQEVPRQVMEDAGIQRCFRR